jgi:hypothetical protein
VTVRFYGCCKSEPETTATMIMAGKSLPGSMYLIKQTPGHPRLLVGVPSIPLPDTPPVGACSMNTKKVALIRTRKCALTAPTSSTSSTRRGRKRTTYTRPFSSTTRTKRRGPSTKSARTRLVSTSLLLALYLLYAHFHCRQNARQR